MHLPVNSPSLRGVCGVMCSAKVTSLARDRAGTRSGLGRPCGFSVCWASSALWGDWS